MKKGKWKIMVIVVIVLLLLIDNTSALFGLDDLIVDAITSFFEALAEFLAELAQRYLVASMVSKMVYAPLTHAIDDLPRLILLNPAIMVERGGGEFVRNPAIEGMVNFMLTIVVPFYIFGIVSTAFYLLFVSGSPMGRARAKSGLLKLLVSIPLALGSIEIMQLLIDISEYLTATILSVTNLELGLDMLKATIGFFQANLYAWVSFGWWPAFRHVANALMIGMPVFVIIFMRYFIMVIMTILFPLTIFMYAFRYSKSFGAALLKMTVWWTFSQVLMAIILVGISVAALSLPLPSDTMLQGCFGIGGFIALAIAPLMSMKIMTWTEFEGSVRDLFYTPWVSLAVSTIGLEIESIGEEEVSPPPPIGPPRIPPSTK